MDQVSSSQLHIQGSNPIIIHRNSNGDTNNHLPSTYRARHCSKHFTCIDSLRGRYNPREERKTQQGSVTCQTHTRQQGCNEPRQGNVLLLNPNVATGPEWREPCPSPHEGMRLPLSSHLTGGLRAVTGQTLLFLGPRFTSKEVT